MISKKEKFLSCERREFPRLDENIFLLYHLRSDVSGEYNKGFATNISGGGLMFEAESNILPGSKLRLEIYQPLKHSKTVILAIPSLAKVVWARNIEKENFEQGENKYQIGIEFLKIQEQDREKIIKYVEDVLPRQ
mgnify:CR=1 FL=1